MQFYLPAPRPAHGGRLPRLAAGPSGGGGYSCPPTHSHRVPIAAHGAGTYMAAAHPPMLPGIIVGPGAAAMARGGPPMGMRAAPGPGRGLAPRGSLPGVRRRPTRRRREAGVAGRNQSESLGRPSRREGCQAAEDTRRPADTGSRSPARGTLLTHSDSQRIQDLSPPHCHPSRSSGPSPKAPWRHWGSARVPAHRVRAAGRGSGKSCRPRKNQPAFDASARRRSLGQAAGLARLILPHVTRL